MLDISSVVFLVLCLSPFIFGATEAGTKCAVATGKVECESDKDKASDVEVFLMDDDGTLNPDDQMGWTTSDENGNFRVEGCGYDFLSDPDPYVKIFTYCNAEKGKYVKTPVVNTFAPTTIEYGTIKVD